ncbi:MAG: hypothetical protein IJI14_10445 [Anaerolineaceae bacterium]|nr:hypothetical protein [Anaerolineaceae bacterium]
MPQAKLTHIVFHCFDRRTGGDFQDFHLYYMPMNPVDLNGFIEFQKQQIEELGYGIVNFDFETRYTDINLYAIFESSGQFCAEPGWFRYPDMPR